MNKRVCRGQAQNFAGRGVQGFGVAAREVAASGAHIGHEHGVAHKHRVAKLVSHASRGVARHIHGVASQAAHVDGVPIGKQMVKLRAVQLEAGFHVEDALEHFLHAADVVANRGFAAQVLLQIRRGAQVVGMGMGFHNPLDLQIIGFDKFDNFVSRLVAGAARLGVVVQHRVDDGASRAWFFVNHIGDGPGGGVKNAMDLGVDSSGVHRKLLFS